MIKKIFKKIRTLTNKHKEKIDWNSITNSIYDQSFHKHIENKSLLSLISTSPSKITEEDYSILETIKAVYFNNRSLFNKTNPSDMWEDFIIPMHKEFLEYLETNNDKQALNHLNEMFSNGLGYGYGTCPDEMEKELKKNNKLKNSLNFYYMDSLINFAEWLGVIPVENIEQGTFGKYIYQNPEDIFKLIENKLGVELKFPEFQFGLYTIESKRGYFSNRHFIYLYIALKIKELCKNTPNPKICEIGGGVGLLAYYCDLIGLKDVTIVDLPSVSLTSSYFLMKNLNHRNFAFNDDKNKYLNNDSIKLIFSDCFEDTPDDYYDIVINCDSMPEINAIEAKKYLNTIQRTSKYFYSINQEGKAKYDLNKPEQSIIHELISDLKNFKRESRNLFWIRKGYVEELYKIEKT